jgi:hypothetical protein
MLGVPARDFGITQKGAGCAVVPYNKHFQPPPPGAGTGAPWALLRRPGMAAPPARCPALPAAPAPPET